MDNQLLRKSITDIAGAHELLSELHAEGLMFHPEDSAEDIVDADGQPLFDDDEAVLLNERMADLYRLDWPAEYECPCGYILKHFGEQ